jgi:hypothetical protein
VRFVVPAIVELAGSNGFDVEDANGALALAELLRLYRESHVRLGDELVQYMRQTYLPTTNVNSHLIEPLLHVLFIESDSKKQRAILKVVA